MLKLQFSRIPNPNPNLSNKVEQRQIKQTYIAILCWKGAPNQYQRLCIGVRLQSDSKFLIFDAGDIDCVESHKSQ